jgi:hypothetical protein
MSRFWLFTLLVLVLTAGSALAQTPLTPAAGGEQFFKVDWVPGERHGTPAVIGQVTNIFGMTATNVRLLVESLDTTGQVTGSTIAYVDQPLAGGQVVNFDVPVPTQASNYRVSIFQFDWLQAGSGEGSE